jgi:uncharacterized protein YjbI with pentapeptide repeats
LRKADLSGADLNEARLNGIDFEDMQLDGAILPKSSDRFLYYPAM